MSAGKARRAQEGSFGGPVLNTIQKCTAMICVIFPQESIDYPIVLNQSLTAAFSSQA
jgi:hypothetical protein